MWKSLDNRQRIYVVLGSFLTLNGLILLAYTFFGVPNAYQTLTGATLLICGIPIIVDQLCNRSKTISCESQEDEEEEVTEEAEAEGREALYISHQKEDIAPAEQKEKRKPGRKPAKVEEKPLEKPVEEVTSEEAPYDKSDEIILLRKEIKNLGGRLRRASQKEEKLNTQLTEARKEVRTADKTGTEEERKNANEKVNTLRVQLRETRKEISQMKKESEAKKRKLDELNSKSSA